MSKNMRDTITITLIANTGVLVEYGDVGMLVDGIHHEPGHVFSKVCKKDLLHMRLGTDVFEHLDYLLFSHEHPDHFSPGFVERHLQFRSVQGIFLPDPAHGSPSLKFLANQIQAQAISHRILDLQPGEAAQFPLVDDLTVTAIGAPHMGPQYAAVKHHCFLLTIAGKHLLFTGDADHIPEYFVPALNGINPDVVFVNPLFYHHANGRKIINEIFRPRTVVIYHMPFAKDDTTQLSHVVERDIKRYGQNGIQPLIFSQEKQRLYLRG